MPRGKNYWEVTFDPEGTDPTAQKTLADLDHETGFKDAIVTIAPLPDSKRLNLKDTRFVGCDFNGGIEKASFTNCEFENCKFEGVHLTKVKFSRCKFKKCHFLHVDLIKCALIDCVYEGNSVSAEHFNCDSTEIDALVFLKSISANLNHLPATTTPEFQVSKLAHSKAKLAGSLYRSNQELFGPHFFSAHRALSIHTLRSRIEEKRFLLTNTGAPLKPRNKYLFYFLTTPTRFDLAVTVFAGALTDWGRSVFRATLFLLVIILCFGIAYHKLKGIDLSWSKSFLRSIEVSLVAGYTAHTNSSDSALVRGVTLLNLLFGIYWYSLIVPVITRKFLR